MKFQSDNQRKAVMASLNTGDAKATMSGSVPFAKTNDNTIAKYGLYTVRMHGNIFSVHDQNGVIKFNSSSMVDADDVAKHFASKSLQKAESKRLVINRANVDEIQADEIVFQMDNDYQQYRSQTQPIQKNLEKKFKKGTYVKEMGVKAWYNAVTSWERTHREDVGTANKDTRIRVAEILEENHRSEMESGNFQIFCE